MPIWENERYCLDTLAQIRKDMGLKTTSEGRWDAMERTACLILFHSTDLAARLAESTLLELNMRKVLMEIHSVTIERLTDADHKNS